MTHPPPCHHLPFKKTICCLYKGMRWMRVVHTVDYVNGNWLPWVLMVFAPSICPPFTYMFNIMLIGQGGADYTQISLASEHSLTLFRADYLTEQNVHMLTLHFDDRFAKGQQIGQVQNNQLRFQGENTFYTNFGFTKILLKLKGVFSQNHVVV